jgi:hypothetical protein
MKIDRDAQLYIYWDAVIDADPTGSTVVLEVDETPYGMDWMGTPVRTGVSTWFQTARTQMRFLGSGRTPTGSDVQLTAGAHVGKPVVTFIDGQSLPCDPTIQITST